MVVSVIVWLDLPTFSTTDCHDHEPKTSCRKCHNRPELNCVADFAFDEYFVESVQGRLSRVIKHLVGVSPFGMCTNAKAHEKHHGCDNHKNRGVFHLV